MTISSAIHNLSFTNNFTMSNLTMCLQIHASKILCSVVSSPLQDSRNQNCQACKNFSGLKNQESTAIQPVILLTSWRSLLKQMKKIFSFYSCFVMYQWNSRNSLALHIWIAILIHTDILEKNITITFILFKSVNSDILVCQPT